MEKSIASLSQSTNTLETKHIGIQTLNKNSKFNRYFWCQQLFFEVANWLCKTIVLLYTYSLNIFFKKCFFNCQNIHLSRTKYFHNGVQC